MTARVAGPPVQKTPARLSRKAAQSDVTREAILTACLRLFAQRGFTSTSIDMIAGAAGITKGAIYWHFDSKDALFDAILELIRSRWQEAVVRSVPPDGQAAQRLDRLFAGYTRLFTEDPEICLFLQRVLLENDDTYSPRVARVYKQTARLIAGILDEGKRAGEFDPRVDSVQLAHLILASIAGATQQHLVNPSLTVASLLTEVKAFVLARLCRRA
jgi:AcrR family transcriptional regulator